jgi:DNA-binding NarL/FixJ family response regulator
MKIFVVDDSPLLRARMQETITQIKNAEIVGEADSALDAIEAIRRTKPEIVILDIRLKAGTGLDVLHEIKKNLDSTITVVVVTNYPYDQYRRLSMSMGADYFFHKSTQWSNMVNMLKALQLAKSTEA